MNQQCPHCRRRIPAISSVAKPKGQKKYNSEYSFYYKMQHKHSKIFPQFAKIRNEQHFDLMQFLQEKIKKPEIIKDNHPVTQRKKWDLPLK